MLHNYHHGSSVSYKTPYLHSLTSAHYAGKFGGPWPGLVWFSVSLVQLTLSLIKQTTCTLQHNLSPIKN